MPPHFNSDEDSFQDRPEGTDWSKLSHFWPDSATFDVNEVDQPDSMNEFYEQLLNRRRDENPLSVLEDGLDLRSNSLTSPDSNPSGLGHGIRRSTMATASSVILPEVGDEINGFQLLEELGSGAFARVFLAQQGSLASRQVVLKISSIEGTEPQALAQLQHTHVVPIYSVHDDPSCGLRAVCMPYFGGTTLARVMGKIWDGRGIPVSGRALTEALDCTSGPIPDFLVSKSSASDNEPIDKRSKLQSSRTRLAGLSYVQAAAWVICRLAEGLNHSHERNIVHRDIKPSNILISAEAVPLLLDFNVSQTVDCNLADATLGGTIAYMAPEQLRAVIRRDIVSLARITQQTDIYSLGLVFYEMLCGPRPIAETSPTSSNKAQLEILLSLRERSAPSVKEKSLLEIPWSLESILRKCLAPEPSDRYATAGQLAEDLECFLGDLPLKTAPELSVVEQARKWNRRHPKLTTAIMVVSLALAVIVPGAQLLSSAFDNLAHRDDLIATTTAYEKLRQFQEGAQQSLCLVNTVNPNEVTLPLGMKSCQKTLAIFEIEKNPDWQNGNYWKRLDRQNRDSLAESVREILLVLASAHVRISPDNDQVVLKALHLLEQAAEIRDLPPSRALALDRARYLRLLGRTSEAEQIAATAESIPVSTPHDTYLLACAHARHRTVTGYREAIRLLTNAIQQSPKHYWSFFERALCHQELQERTSALSDFGTCIGLSPESPYAHFNHGYILSLEGHLNDAINDYSNAIRFDSKFDSAYLNRGLIYLELRRPADALKDFQKVNDLGRDDDVTQAGKAMALERLGEHAELDQLIAALIESPNWAVDESKQQLASKLAFAISNRAPRLARRIFDEILESNASHPQALYGQGMLFMEEQKLREAVDAFNLSLSASPRFIEPLRFRAVALARLGQLDQASEDADECVRREPTNPDSLYIAACVASISARRHRSEKLAEYAIRVLRLAIEFGAERDRAYSDPDFSALRGDLDFQELVGAKPDPQPQKQTAPT